MIEELDERDREEFYRLKKIQDKKKVSQLFFAIIEITLGRRDSILWDLISDSHPSLQIIREKQKRLAEELSKKEAAASLSLDQPRNMLEQEHDPDIVF